MNSANIVKVLEDLHPSPSLHLDAKLHGPIQEAMDGLAFVVWWPALPQVPSMLNPTSSVYFEETRKVTFGASLKEVADMKGGDAAWETAAAPGGPAEKLKDVLTKHRKDEGPFTLGSEPSYGDFIVASVFECVERCHAEDYKRLMALDPTFPALHAACREWLEKDD